MKKMKRSSILGLLIAATVLHLAIELIAAEGPRVPLSLMPSLQLGQDAHVAACDARLHPSPTTPTEILPSVLEKQIPISSTRIIS
jgi:hypothetical protein